MTTSHKSVLVSARGLDIFACWEEEDLHNSPFMVGVVSLVLNCLHTDSYHNSPVMVGVVSLYEF